MKKPKNSEKRVFSPIWAGMSAVYIPLYTKNGLYESGMIVTRHRNTYNKHYKPKKNFLKGKIHEKPQKNRFFAFLGRKECSDKKVRKVKSCLKFFFRLYRL